MNVKIEKIEETSNEILEILRKNEITYRELYLLFETVKDEFKKNAIIKKD